MAIQQVIVGLSLFAFAAVLALTIGAWRAHKVVRSRQSLAFFTCFTLISMGILFRLLLDAIISVPGFIPGYIWLALPDDAIILISTLCVLSGYTLLLLVVEHIENKSMWILVYLLVIFTLILSGDMFHISNVLAAVLLALLAHRFWNNYINTSKTNALLVYLGFLALFIGHLAALFTSFGQQAVVVFLIFQVIGYFLLFAMMWRVWK